MLGKIKFFLMDLISTIQASKIYSKDHPIIRDQIDKTYANLQDILKQQEELVLGIVDDVFVWENEIMFDLSKKSQSLILYLKRKGIERIEFHQAVNKDELHKFLQRITLSPSQASQEKDEILSLEGIKNIKAGKIKAPTKDTDQESPKLKNLKAAYMDSVKISSQSINKALRSEDIDYLDLRFNILNVMENFMGRHQEILNLTSIKRKDLITFAHLLNVSILSMFFASKKGFAKDDTLDIGIAALFHDIGKIAISKQILKKESKLTDKEFDKMKDHTTMGTEILIGYVSTFGILPAVVAFEHHMRYDSSGYPKVPYPQPLHIASLIVSICDVYDALAQKRSYKTDYPPLRIFKIMEQEKGKLFEPRLFDVFFRVMGVWPVGCLVKLSNKKIAVVREVNEHNMYKPKIEMLTPKPTGEIVDLAERNGNLKIVDSLNPLNEGSKYVKYI
ncbi:MAG: HD domain-containing protein [Candidatus Aminicenantes bacterium]|nr:HD domain-containing protein [Candidatus Aminicenantes bacterium]